VKVLLLFLDGVGIGAHDPDVNPIFRAQLPTLRYLIGQKLFSTSRPRASTQHADLLPVNATLGIAGLPQSGTGQTAIFTGVNAARKIGRHFGPYPTTELRPIIYEKNIFRQLKAHRRSVCFANAFPRQFFEYTNSGTRRLTVTTLSCLMADVPLLTADALLKNQAVSADLHRQRWPEMGYPLITPISAQEAGRHLAEIARSNDFTLFEYWLTDHAGHSQDMARSVEVLERFDAFLSGILERTDLNTTLIVMISDHGNIEDLSTKTHTRNRVPCIIVGKHRHRWSNNIRNLTHITPTVLSILA
jgi:2,3-bisphosphoglycerate-independent phosphoglycerate mutase